MSVKTINALQSLHTYANDPEGDSAAVGPFAGRGRLIWVRLLSNYKMKTLNSISTKQPLFWAMKRF